jgi:hypothetical protein
MSCMTSTNTMSDTFTSIDTRVVAELVAIDPAIRVMVGAVHAALDREAFASTSPAIWIWSTDNRFPPKLFHEPSLESSLETAQHFLHQTYMRPAATQRAADEAEGGIIIPDYMY